MRDDGARGDGQGPPQLEHRAPSPAAVRHRIRSVTAGRLRVTFEALDRIPSVAVHWIGCLGGLLQQRSADSFAAGSEDAGLVEALRRGREDAFLGLVQRHQSAMLRVASTFVSSAAVAEEVVQEAWLGVLHGLDGFQGRSSLRSWIFGILTNCARSRGVREGRSAPFSSFGGPDEDEPAVDPSRFLGADHPRWPGHWASPPEQWAEAKLAAKETLGISEANQRVLLHRARSKVRARVEQFMREGSR